MSNIMLDKSSRKRISVSITSVVIIILRKETDMVSLCADDDSEFDLKILAGKLLIKFGQLTFAQIAPNFAIIAFFMWATSSLMTLAN